MSSETVRVDRTERLLNLVLCLMAARIPVHRATIRAAIPGYAQASSDAAFERMFERDKDELRNMGIPIETVMDAHGDVLGYRIRPEEYELPAVTFSAQERAALAVAATLWEATSLGPSAVSALRKLEAAQPSAVVHDHGSAMIVVRSPDVALHALPLLTALRERQSVRFRYRTAGDTEAVPRHVDPWGLVARQGGWYLVGHDRDRADVRVFRLSRIHGQVTSSTEGIQTSRPTHLDLEALIDPSGGDDPAIADVHVRAGRGGELRRHAMPCDTSIAARDVTVQARTRESLVSMLCAAGDGVLLLPGQEDLERDVIDSWSTVARRHRGRAGTSPGQAP